MNKFLSVLARVLLAQIFLLQVGVMIFQFVNTPGGYEQYQMDLGHHGLPGIFAPLIVLIQLVGGLSLLTGYKTRICGITMAIYAVFISFALGVSPFQYLAIAGGLITLAMNPPGPLSLDNRK
jgi:putative oxidoreductase